VTLVIGRLYRVVQSTTYGVIRLLAISLLCAFRAFRTWQFVDTVYCAKWLTLLLSAKFILLWNRLTSNDFSKLVIQQIGKRT